jgi:hypothetical protein
MPVFLRISSQFLKKDGSQGALANSNKINQPEDLEF